MYRFALLVIFVTLLTSSIAQAASYQRRDGTIVDPILDRSGIAHYYSGPNFEPFATLYGADLTYADLAYADLSNADLSNADLSNADLSGATLTGAKLRDADLANANLYYAKLSSAYLFDADLTDANLSDANLDYATLSPGTTLYDGQTVAQHGFDAASLQAYLEVSPISASSASNLNLVPEPASVLLLLTGLLMLARVRF